ncbi:amidase, partial [Paraburkholderia sp. SIMBA_053]
LGLAELVRTREASARELLDTAISRTEAVNPAINAIVLKDYEAARERASRYDASMANGGNGINGTNGANGANGADADS